VAAALPETGEVAAHRRLDRFLDGGVDRYAEDRDRPDRDGTSRLSVDLKYGTLHPRQLLSRLGAGDGPRTFETELCWREFYADVLHHRPDSAWQDYDRSMRSIPWDTGKRSDERFDAWAHGRTGYPIVDAGMRQLLGEGWMHNRVRMLTASFLVKDLHLDWRRGAAWFLDHLVDGDLASNNHGWQWVAGCGTDAAPYVRVFNPVTQGRRFDPDGAYVRRWVPELAGIEGKAVHEPWKQRGDAGLLGASASDYPDRIVDHATEREEALARYGRR
jgi:deoxyribodipyrimidine photo-lyase